MIRTIFISIFAAALSAFATTQLVAADKTKGVENKGLSCSFELVGDEMQITVHGLDRAPDRGDTVRIMYFLKYKGLSCSAELVGDEMQITVYGLDREPDTVRIKYILKNGETWPKFE